MKEVELTHDSYIIECPNCGMLLGCYDIHSMNTIIKDGCELTCPYCSAKFNISPSYEIKGFVYD